MEFFKHFFGEHNYIFHIAGLIWCLIGSLIAKTHEFLSHKKEQKALGNTIVFKLKYWIKHNLFEVVIGILVSFAFVRFLDTLIHWLNPKLQAGFQFQIPVTEDQVFYYFIAGGLIQLWIHKKYHK